MTGPVRPPLEVTEVDGSPDGRPINKIVVSNGDLSVSGTTATIDTSGTGGTAALTETYIGFGDASDLLTGSTKLTWNDTATSEQLLITGSNTSNTYGQLKLVNTANTANSAPDLLFYHDKGAGNAADGDYLGHFIFTGRNSVDAETTYYQFYARAKDVTDGDEDAEVYHQLMLAGTLRTYFSMQSVSNSGYISFNDDGQNVDFRIECLSTATGIDTTHALKMDGATGNLGLGVGTPTPALHIKRDNSITDMNSSGAAAITIEQDGTGDAALSFLLTGTMRWMMGVDNNDSNKLKFATGATDFSSGAKVTINTDGDVGIGTVSPAKTLHVSDGSTTGVTGGTEVAILITDDTNPRIYFEDLSEASGDRIMDIMADSEALTFNSLNDAASTYDKQNIFVINRDGYVSVNGQPDTTGNLGKMQINVGNSTQTALTLISTDADAEVSPTLDLYRHSGSPADGDDIGKITFSGEDDGDAKQEWASISVELVDASAGSEDARLRFRATTVGGSAQEYLRMGGQDVIFNESSGDINFRVESNGNATMLVIDGGDDVMGVGATPTASKAQLQVNEDATFLRYIGENTATMDITPQMLHNTIQTLKSTGSRVYASLPDVAETVAGMCMTFVSVGGDMSIIGKTSEGQSINGVAASGTEPTVAFDTAYSRVELIALTTSMWTCWVNGAIATVTNT